MRARAYTVGEALLGLIGPIVWAAHFFSLYLAESFLCVSTEAGTSVRLTGGVLTIVAIAALLYARRRTEESAWASLVRPLIDLSIIAVVWTAIPLVVLHTCTPAGA
jgi:hypothetical protein